MTCDLILAPYDSGHRDRRMGRGPFALAKRLGWDPAAEPDDTAVAHATVLEVEAAFLTEIGSAFELHRRVADAVASSVAAGCVPLLLSGNCNNAVGVVAGLLRDGADDLGVVWLDGHGDCNTPETFEGDFLDAMGISTLTGRCWQAMAATVPGFRPLPDDRVALVGGHGADAGALAVLAASAIAHLRPVEIRHRLGSVLDAMVMRGVRRIYLHLDADVLDRDRVGSANAFAPPGGLDGAQMTRVVAAVTARFPVVAATVASYDPACDTGGHVADAVMNAIGGIGGEFGAR